MSSDHADDALSHAVITMRPGWIALRGCVLDADAPARVRYALLHPQVGIALLDVVPGRTTPHAPDCLRRKLDAAAFHTEFGCNPPILYFCIPLRVLSDVGHLLEHEFSRQPVSALPRGDAWVTAAQAVLSAQPLRPAQQLAGCAGQTLSRAIQGWQQPARRFGGARLLAAFWGLALSTVGGGALFLQYLGPPEKAAQAMAPLSITKAAASLEPSVADLRRTLIENEQAILELQSRLERLSPDAGPGMVANAVLTGSTLSDAVAERGTGIASPVQELADIAQAEAAQRRLVDTNAQVEHAGQQVTAAEQQLAAVQQQSEDAQTAGAAMSKQLTGAQAQPSRLEERRSAAEQQLRSLQAQADRMQEDRAMVEQAADQVLLAGITERQAERPIIQAEQDSKGIADAEARLTRAFQPMDQAIVQHVEAAPAVLDDGIGVVAASAATAPAASHDNAVFRLAPVATVPPLPDRGPDPASAALAETMLRRGNALLQHGDVSAARLLYDRAASAGSARAATAMGKTFDATVLAGIGAVGLSPDPALAALWYRRGLSLGDEEARTRLQFLPPAASRAAAQAGLP